MVEHLSRLFVEVTNLVMQSDDNTHRDLKAPHAMLQTLLDTLHALLKYVSEVVRKALQAKKAGGDHATKEAEMAEELLLMNKPFTDLMTLITQLVRELLFNTTNIWSMTQEKTRPLHNHQEISHFPSCTAATNIPKCGILHIKVLYL